MNSGITSVVRPAIGPAIRSAFEGGFAPSQAGQQALRDEENNLILDESGQPILEG